MANRVSQVALSVLGSGAAVSNARVSQVTVTALFSLAAPPGPPPANAAQIAFCGVRRLPRAAPRKPDACRYDERTFTYSVSGTILTPAPVTSPLILRKTIRDYDFDLYQVMFEYQAAALIPPVVCSFLLYDAYHNQISNIPLLDSFLNGKPGSAYENGALQPPLRFPQNSRIRIDLYNLSLIAPLTATVQLIGRQRIPV
jgi:hypothetical protein